MLPEELAEVLIRPVPTTRLALIGRTTFYRLRRTRNVGVSRYTPEIQRLTPEYQSLKVMPSARWATCAILASQYSRISDENPRR